MKKRFWVSDCRLQNADSFGFHIPQSTIHNPQSEVRIPQSEIRNGRGRLPSAMGSAQRCAHVSGSPTGVGSYREPSPDGEGAFMPPLIQRTSL